MKMSKKNPVRRSGQDLQLKTITINEGLDSSKGRSRINTCLFLYASNLEHSTIRLFCVPNGRPGSDDLSAEWPSNRLPTHNPGLAEPSFPQPICGVAKVVQDDT